MKIIISPAKKMVADQDGFFWEGRPVLLEETKEILEKLRTMTALELKDLWKCNDKIAEVNLERIETMSLTKNNVPAILAYEGIQYRSMAPGVFTDDALKYIGKNLRIVSGFYGILSPFDGVVPYRLEMQAKLALRGHKNLYEFWGNKIAEALCEKNELVINLASKEYSKSVLPYLPKTVKVCTCKFVEKSKGKFVERATACKMARGEMVRLLAMNQVEKREEIVKLCPLGYVYAMELSSENELVFVKGGM